MLTPRLWRAPNSRFLKKNFFWECEGKEIIYSGNKFFDLNKTIPKALLKDLQLMVKVGMSVPLELPLPILFRHTLYPEVSYQREL